ncbi:terminase TerL endonuclease subunit [Brevundimonas sp.]|uniref:terminase large subunit n=1 Tax=Brevundimonas sp. TaxID=1871086 RepID=UPI00289853CD|nr:terminase TerL endonuclease subunit [Brevundimonas sp.]
MVSKPANKRLRTGKALTHARDYAGIGERYARDVVAGKITACKWVKRACKRHLDDLERAENDPSYPFYFDAERADDPCDFGEKQLHVEGNYDPPTIVLADWQIFITTFIFGWRRKADGGRRISEVYIEVARKAGKSSWTAFIAIYCVTCEGEVGPQVIIGASTGAQAAKVFEPARKMIEKNPALREAFGLKTWARSITCEANGGYIQTINAKGSTQDGHNPHLGILDELHAHANRALYDVIKSAFGSRTNPLLWSITTAGFSTTGICYEVRTYATKVLEGIFEADHFFGIIYTLDDAEVDADGTVLTPADDPYDPNVWIKANPNLGLTPKLSFMHAAAADAKASPAAEGNFKTKNLNVWLNSASAWLNMVRWRECADPSLDWSAFEGLDCYIGLDLADKDDICAAVVAAIDRDGRLIMKSLFWLPEAALNNPTHAQGSAAAPYRLWVEQGHLQLTPGDWVDHNVIEDQLRDWVDRFSVRAIVGDQFAAFLQMASRLNADLATPDNPLAHVLSKNARNVTDPAKELEARVKSGPTRLAHDGNPVMDWMASNVVISRRTDGTILPKKATADSPNKIDGIDAAVNAIQPMLGAVKETPMKSYLEREEPIFF